VKHVNQEGTEVQGGVDVVRQELAEMRERMAVIKQETTANPSYVRPQSENKANGSPGVSVYAGPCPRRYETSRGCHACRI
jgi:hypothetical protein